MCLMSSQDFLKSAGSCKIGEISLKMIPFFGKSGISLMASLRTCDMTLVLGEILEVRRIFFIKK